MDETSELQPVDDGGGDTTIAPAPVTTAAPKAGVSRTTLVISVLLGMLAAGAIGVLIGWKVEQERVKDDLANIRPVGTVTAVDEGSVTIDLDTADGTKTYEITDRTTVEGGEVEEGSSIFIRSWRKGDDGQLEVINMVVLGEP